MNDVKIRIAKAPAQSPDLNLTELVWADIKKFVSTKLCNNLEEAQLAIDEYRSGLTWFKKNN